MISLSGVIIDTVKLSNLLSRVELLIIYFLKKANFFLLWSFLAETFKYFFGIGLGNATQAVRYIDPTISKHIHDFDEKKIA